MVFILSGNNRWRRYHKFVIAVSYLPTSPHEHPLGVSGRRRRGSRTVARSSECALAVHYFRSDPPVRTPPCPRARNHATAAHQPRQEAVADSARIHNQPRHVHCCRRRLAQTCVSSMNLLSHKSTQNKAALKAVFAIIFVDLQRRQRQKPITLSTGTPRAARIQTACTYPVPSHVPSSTTTRVAGVSNSFSTTSCAG